VATFCTALWLTFTLPLTVRKLIAEEDDLQKKDAALAELARLGQTFDLG
jgi:hypothetical protein